MRFIKCREMRCASPKEGLKQVRMEVQVTEGLKVVGRYDTLAQAQKAYPDAMIAAGYHSKLVGETAMNQEQYKALKLLINTIIETVEKSGPMGAPGGAMYAALMQFGCTLSQFESLMNGLVKAGKVVKCGECYHAA